MKEPDHLKNSIYVLKKNRCRALGKHGTIFDFAAKRRRDFYKTFQNKNRKDSAYNAKILLTTKRYFLINIIF